MNLARLQELHTSSQDHIQTMLLLLEHLPFNQINKSKLVNSMFLLTKICSSMNTEYINKHDIEIICAQKLAELDILKLNQFQLNGSQSNGSQLNGSRLNCSSSNGPPSNGPRLNIQPIIQPIIPEILNNEPIENEPIENEPIENESIENESIQIDQTQIDQNQNIPNQNQIDQNQINQNQIDQNQIDQPINQSTHSNSSKRTLEEMDEIDETVKKPKISKKEEKKTQKEKTQKEKSQIEQKLLTNESNINDCRLSVDVIQNVINDILTGTNSVVIDNSDGKIIYYRNGNEKSKIDIFFHERNQNLVLTEVVSKNNKIINRYVVISDVENVASLNCSNEVKDALHKLYDIIIEKDYVPELSNNILNNDIIIQTTEL